MNIDLEIRMATEAGRWSDVERLNRSAAEQPRQAGGQWHGLKVGDRVKHETDGSGRVVEVNNDDLTVEHDLFAGQLKRWSASKVSKLA
jgi:dsDNA-specific endonuclease/ATPase MutS2